MAPCPHTNATYATSSHPANNAERRGLHTNDSDTTHGRQTSEIRRPSPHAAARRPKDDPTLPADRRNQIVAELANHYNRLVNEHPDIEAEIDVWCSDLNDNRSMWEVLRDTCIARGLL